MLKSVNVLFKFIILKILTESNPIYILFMVSIIFSDIAIQCIYSMLGRGLPFQIADLHISATWVSLVALQTNTQVALRFYF